MIKRIKSFSSLWIWLQNKDAFNWVNRSLKNFHLNVHWNLVNWSSIDNWQLLDTISRYNDLIHLLDTSWTDLFGTFIWYIYLILWYNFLMHLNTTSWIDLFHIQQVS